MHKGRLRPPEQARSGACRAVPYSPVAKRCDVSRTELAAQYVGAIA